MIVRAMLSLVVALLCAGAVQADDLMDGIVAYAIKDYATALSKFRIAAEQGKPGAQTSLGVMYENGHGLAQDYKEAAGWYQLAAKQGNASAQYRLGNLYYIGRGVAQDYKEAVRWYQLAAAQGDPAAQ
jgi:TPR repeat protein